MLRGKLIMFQLRSRKNPKGPSMSQARQIKKDLGIASLASIPSLNEDFHKKGGSVIELGKKVSKVFS